MASMIENSAGRLPSLRSTSPERKIMKPTNKVAAGALAGAIVAIVTWAAKTFAHVDISPDAAIGLSTAITFIVQYFVPDSASDA